MGPAIALRLRQHLTLTPQVQQALKLLQMSALEFAQEMEQALTANPFLEENPEAPQPALRDAATLDDVVVPQEQPSAPPLERDQEDWGGANDAQPTLTQHLRELGRANLRRSTGAMHQMGQSSPLIRGFAHDRSPPLRFPHRKAKINH